MAATTHPQLAQSLQLARLRQVLNWIGLAVVVVGMLEFGAAIFLSFPVIAIHATGMFCFGIVLWMARSRALRGDLRAAVLISLSIAIVSQSVTIFDAPPHHRRPDRR